MSTSDLPAVRRRVRDTAVPSKFSGLGVKTVAVLLKHASFDSAEGVAAMRRPLESLADTLAQLDPLELFSDWSPPRDPPLVPVPLVATANASATKSVEYDASKALNPDLQSFWQSGATKSAWWSVSLEASPVQISAVRVKFRPTQLPDSVTLEVSTKNSGSPSWVASVAASGKSVRELTILTMPASVSAAQVSWDRV